MTEIRRIEVHDPRLSDEANRLLTEEVRKVVGRDTVTVSDGTPDRAHGRLPGAAPGVRTATVNRPLIALTFVAAVVVGGIVALASHKWWVFAVAICLHAVGTILVAGGILRLTAQTEHMDPEISAWLQADGVADPDGVLTELVSDYTSDASAGARS